MDTALELLAGDLHSVLFGIIVIQLLAMGLLWNEMRRWQQIAIGTKQAVDQIHSMITGQNVEIASIKRTLNGGQNTK